MRLVYIAFGWVAGILLAATANSLHTAHWLFLAGTVAVALWLLRDASRWRQGMVVLLAIALGGLRLSLVPTDDDVSNYVGTGGLTLEGVVASEPDVRDDRIQLQLAVELVTRIGETSASDGLVLVQAQRTVDVQFGDRIIATGLLITPEEADTFSYADFLARSGVFSIMRNAAVEVVSSGHGNPFYATLIDLKGRAATAIASALPEPQAALLTGILLGNERGIAPEVDEAFQATGSSHIVAISGFNMVILSGIVFRILGRFEKRRLSTLLGILVIAIYTLFVGANAAVVRAAIMSSLLVIGENLERRTYIPASLAFVALLMSVQDPTVLWDISFQLSFFAVLGLALFTDPLAVRFDSLLQRLIPNQLINSVGSYLKEPVVVTLAAQITALPLTMHYFNRVSLVFVPVNLLIVPAQAVLLLLGGVATLVFILSPAIAQIIFWFDLILLSWTTAVVRAFASVSFAETDIYLDSRLIVIYFAILMGAAVMYATKPGWARWLGHFIRRRAVFSATIFAGIGTAILGGAVGFSRPDGNLHVYLLDMGHSNAIFMETPGGAHMLIDGGRFPSRLLTALGDRMPFTDRTIEVLAISQPDEADMAALAAVLNRYDIGVAMLNGQPNLSETFVEVQARLSRYKGVIVRSGYALDFDDGVRIEVLHPQEQPDLSASLNEHALVLRVSYGGVSFLLTADVSQAGQRTILETGGWPLARVMQVPQHGTINALDEDFLDAVQPQVLILQSDRANRRGDPDPDTLTLMGDMPLFRTDEGGTIHFWTDGSDLWVQQER